SFCFGAIVSFVASLAFETPRCHFAVLARMVEVIAIKALGSARSPTKRDDFHSERQVVLVPPLQSLTKLASLRRLFLAQQPLAMELPLASPASCELRSVIRFLAAKKKSAKEIHEELCQVYGEKSV
ncbi:hypothetical protein TNCV_2830021, partial [Trichonephila clavipes]